MCRLKFNSWYETLSENGCRQSLDESILDGKNVKKIQTIHISGCEIRIDDSILPEQNKVKFIRRIRKTGRITSKQEGIAFGMDIQFEGGRQLRYGIPACQYTQGVPGKHTYTEERLTAPLIIGYEADKKASFSIARMKTARWTEQEKRRTGESCFLHKTEVGSLGYEWQMGGKNVFCTRWPYEEVEKSVALDSKGTPMKAFYPLDHEDWEIELHYEMIRSQGKSFTDSLYEVYVQLAGHYQKEGNEIIELPFSLQDEMEFRKRSLMKSYREFESDGAGFFFHFDPEKGYASEPTGFGTSFNTIPHSTYVHILEYGFTGRQNHTAWILARDKGKEWIDRGKKVIDFFLEHCQTENGWIYSLYDLKKKEPFCSFGDADAPKLHYMDYKGAKGNYLRTMTEPLNDVLEFAKWCEARGDMQEKWLSYVKRFADFLVSLQNGDGSWYRSYEPDGTPVFMLEEENMTEEECERGRKSATAIPIPFLCNLSEYLPEKSVYQEAAVKAGEYVLQKECGEELFQGGTLDNPNIVDKEAAQYAMAGCWNLYKLTGEKRFLDGAVLAAKQFVTWNYIWNVPSKEGTILFEKGFCTKGMGAINSIWCGGVVDIYSLFHIRELYLVGREVKDEFLMQMAGWICTAAHQIMSWPGDSMGFADVGMQPEGFGICPQGMDEGMIHKGDIWGTLGWIYSAGIDGVDRYLKELEKSK